jgi:hypothetical protein
LYFKLLNMKHYLLLIALLIGYTCSGQKSAFHKGALLVSISEGSTTANYSTMNTTNIENPRAKFNCEMDGIRDPLFIEFGISRRWGIGLSSGADIFSVNSKEFTFDLNYHLYSGRRVDWSVYTSVGSFSVGFKEKIGETDFNYMAKGGIFRVGTKFRYYFWKRLGVLGMLSSYSGNAEQTKNSSSYEGQKYSTNITGTAVEFGLCFRFF